MPYSTIVLPAQYWKSLSPNAVHQTENAWRQEKRAGEKTSLRQYFPDNCVLSLWRPETFGLLSLGREATVKEITWGTSYSLVDMPCVISMQKLLLNSECNLHRAKMVRKKREQMWELRNLQGIYQLPQGLSWMQQEVQITGEKLSHRRIDWFCQNATQPWISWTEQQFIVSSWHSFQATELYEMVNTIKKNKQPG